eukprot:446224_1
MAKSKICVSIWKALIHEQESKWNMTQLRNMTVDEVANWIRSMHREFNIATPDFNLETFVQVVYNKKLDGRHIRRDEIDRQTLQKWFVEWNESAHVSETVPNATIGVIEWFFAQLKKRKQIERQLRRVAPGKKKFDTKKLGLLVQTLRRQWKEAKTEIAHNRWTVKMIKKYF